MSRTSSLPGRPAEPAAGGEEGEPGLLLAGEHLELDAGLLRARARAPRRRWPASRTAEVANGSSVLDALVLGGLQRLVDDRDQPVDALGADGPAVVEELGEPQLRLVRVRGQRAGARVRVHHQQMHRVRTHVEDTESHVRNATARSARLPSRCEPSRTRAAGDLPWTRAKDEKGEGRQVGQKAKGPQGRTAGSCASDSTADVRRRPRRATRRASTSPARGSSSRIRPTTSRSSAAI